MALGSRTSTTLSRGILILRPLSERITCSSVRPTKVPSYRLLGGFRLVVDDGLGTSGGVRSVGTGSEGSSRVVTITLKPYTHTKEGKYGMYNMLDVMLEYVRRDVD